MNPETTRASLLSRVRDTTDTTAWREFESRYRELILSYALSLGLQHADAEDAAQAVLLKLSKTLRNFEYSPGRGRFRDYLGRVVRSAIAELFARPSRLQTGVDTKVMASLASDEPPEADARWEREWADHHYRLAMNTIRETFEARSVEIFDRIVAGEGIEPLSAAYGLSTQAVHKVKQRIRHRMQELIVAQVREEDESDG